MITFEKWYNEIADMPFFRNGKWEDLEDGLTFESWLGSDEKERRKTFFLDGKTKESRNFASQFGGKALTGSTKQKKWGEEIRKNFLKESDHETAELLCLLTIFNSAKFWIENRNLKYCELKEKAQAAAQLIKKANRANRDYEQQIIVDPATRIITETEESKKSMAEYKSFVDEFEKLFI